MLRLVMGCSTFYKKVKAHKALRKLETLNKGKARKASKKMNPRTASKKMRARKARKRMKAPVARKKGRHVRSKGTKARRQARQVNTQRT